MGNGCCPPDGADEESEDARHRETVRERYGEAARTSDPCCGPGSSEEYTETLGYHSGDAEGVPDATNLGLGCGNPGAIASLVEGETVVDLGSGPGFDCFIAARAVGHTGHVIGVDMTPDMVERARSAAREHGFRNVDFRLGEIEHLPVRDSTADVIISNCVINLSPDKSQVYDEAFRVLKPGGRVAISDVVRKKDLPKDLRYDPDALAGCISGAASPKEHTRMLQEAGFVDVEVSIDPGSDDVMTTWSDEHDLSQYLASASVTARKPVSET